MSKIHIAASPGSTNYVSVACLADTKRPNMALVRRLIVVHDMRSFGSKH